MATHRYLHPLKRFLFRSTGYSYPNMGRLFLRLFVGIMLLQLGLRQLYAFDQIKDIFPSMLGMGSECSIIVLASIAIICSLFIMVGLCTRIMCVPPFLSMILADIYLKPAEAAQTLLPWQQLNYLPMMFMGIYFFLFLVGPGKISLDYMFSLRIIHSEDRNEDEELEIV